MSSQYEFDRSNTDIMIAMHQSITEVRDMVRGSMAIMTEEMREMRNQLNMLANDRKYYFEQQERNHDRELNRIMSLLRFKNHDIEESQQQSGQSMPSAISAGAQRTTSLFPATANEIPATKSEEKTEQNFGGFDQKLFESSPMSSSQTSLPTGSSGSAAKGFSQHAKPEQASVMSVNETKSSTQAAPTTTSKSASAVRNNSSTPIVGSQSAGNAPQTTTPSARPSATFGQFSTGANQTPLNAPKNVPIFGQNAFAQHPNAISLEQAAAFMAQKNVANFDANDYANFVVANNLLTPPGFSSSNVNLPRNQQQQQQSQQRSAENPLFTQPQSRDSSSLFKPKPIEESASAANKAAQQQQQDIKPSATQTPSNIGKFLFGGASSTGSAPLTFNSLANSTPSFNFLNPTASVNTPPKNNFDSKQFQIFRQPQKDANNASAKGDDNDLDDAEEFVPNVHFEPVIPLPSLVEKKTGEEDEETVFTTRCKLYRFDADVKENKERGVGEIKILKHKETGRFRCVMRRDQVLNICANFNLTSGMNITQKPNMPSVYMWHCLDFSQDDTPNGAHETFTARFKEAATAGEFAEKFRDAVNNKSSSPSASSAQKAQPDKSKKPEGKEVAERTTAKPNFSFNTPKTAIITKPTEPQSTSSNDSSAKAAALSFCFKPPSFGNQTKESTNKDVKKSPLSQASPISQASSPGKTDESEDYGEDEEGECDDDYENINDNGDYEEEDQLLLEEECHLTVTDAFVSPLKMASAKSDVPSKCTLRVFESSGVIYITFTDPKTPQEPLFTHYVYKSSKLGKASATSVEYMASHSTTSAAKKLMLTFADSDSLQRFMDHFEDGIKVADELDFNESD